jgi:hypothetical protein
MYWWYCAAPLHRQTLPDNPVAFDAPLDPAVACTSLVRSIPSPSGLKRGIGESGPANCLHGDAVVDYWAVCAHFRHRRVASSNPPFALAVYRGVSGRCSRSAEGLSVATQLK